jgi:hypothetical protein
VGGSAQPNRMKFEIKTEPVCAVLVSVPAYIAIVIITLYTGMKAEDAWLPLTVTLVIMYIALFYVAPK